MCSGRDGAQASLHKTVIEMGGLWTGRNLQEPRANRSIYRFYHGRQTGPSSTSIFGDIGGVLMRVDDSIM